MTVNYNVAKDSINLTYDNTTIPIILKYNKKSKKIYLRFNLAKSSFIITMPSKKYLKEAKLLVDNKRDWIKYQYEQHISERVLFKPQAIIPVRGKYYKLINNEQKQSAPVIIDNYKDQLIIANRKIGLDTTLRTWLKNEARNDFVNMTFHYASILSLNYNKISIRDQSGRWGSCSSDKNLSFSWRLIMAPPFVLQYVAAHEICHLAEMNHGPNFWSLLDSIVNGKHIAIKWLKENGSSLHNYG